MSHSPGLAHRSPMKGPSRQPTRRAMRITYDRDADAAYIRLTSPPPPGASAPAPTCPKMRLPPWRILVGAQLARECLFETFALQLLSATRARSWHRCG